MSKQEYPMFIKEDIDAFFFLISKQFSQFRSNCNFYVGYGLSSPHCIW